MKCIKRIVLNKRSVIVIIILVLFSITFLAFNDKDFKIAKNLDIFVTLFREVDLFYVDEKDPEDLINSSIQGMLESLDPYTSFIPESELDEFKFMTTGQYGGIGALIRKAGDYTLISEPYEGFPAQKAGLRAGDTLISINGISTRGRSISEVSEMLKGAPNTELLLKLKRYGDTTVYEKSFIREKITIKNVPYSGLIANDIGYIRLGNFTKNAAKEVRKAFLDLKEQGARSIILDLRGNPGGLLNEAIEIANIWIDKNIEIVSTRGKTKQWDNSYTTSKPSEDASIPLVVLVNRGSASASEIVAGSLQDLDRAVIIGQRTFGKGLVQTTRPLSYNTQLKITTAKYYIPSGRCIQALDYSHRNEDGSVGHVPDSLISEFKTKNGRVVYDGGGINPDFEIPFPKPSNISVGLYTSNLIFDYATIFRHMNDSISTPEKFKISDKIYSEFVQFIENKEFNYNTASSEKLDELILLAEEEGYYPIIKDEVTSLQEKLKADKTKDLVTFKDEIKELILDEIISRYYFQEGRIRANFNDDPQLDKAIEILHTSEEMHSILQGINNEGNIKLARQ